MEIIELKRQVAKAFVNTKKDLIYIYDREKEKVVTLNNKDVDRISCELLDEEINSYEEELIVSLIIESNRVVPLISLNKEQIRELMELFISVEKNKELNECLESKKFFSTFNKKIEKLNLMEKWLDFVLKMYKNELEFFIDYSKIAEIEADEEEYKEIINISRLIYDLAPWEVFSDNDFIVHNDYKNVYYCVMGNAGQTFGLSIYEEEDVDGLKTILVNKKLDPILLMSMQKNYTVYFDPVDKDTEQYLFYKDLGLEENVKCIPSISRFNKGIIKNNSLTLSEAKLMKEALINFVIFYRKLLESNKGLYFDADLDIHISFRIKDKVYIDSIELDKKPENYLCDTLDIPHIEDVKLKNATYEIDVRGFKMFNHDARGTINSAGYLLIILDLETNQIIKGELIDGSKQEVLYNIYEAFQDVYDTCGTFANKVVVSNKFTKSIVENIFLGKVKTKIAKFKSLDDIYEELSKMNDMDRYN